MPSQNENEPTKADHGPRYDEAETPGHYFAKITQSAASRLRRTPTVPRHLRKNTAFLQTPRDIFEKTSHF